MIKGGSERWMAQYKKEAVQKIKYPLIRKVKMLSYYRNKLPDKNILLDPNPTVVKCPTTERNLIKLAAFSERKTLELGPCGYDKKTQRYVRMVELNRDKISTKMSL